MSKNIKFPQRGEIWVIDYNYKPRKGENGEDIESRIKKFRPLLVISNNTQNEYDEEIIVVPLSSQDLEEIEPFEVLIVANKNNAISLALF